MRIGKLNGTKENKQQERNNMKGNTHQHVRGKRTDTQMTIVNNEAGKPRHCKGKQQNTKKVCDERMMLRRKVRRNRTNNNATKHNPGAGTHILKERIVYR